MVSTFTEVWTETRPTKNAHLSERFFDYQYVVSVLSL